MWSRFASSLAWAAGTVGTVVEALDKGAVVEIADEHGHTLDMLSLPYAALEPRPPTDQQRLNLVV
ncbi:MAG: DUF4926 domain-containing protein [Solirubrobacteraceae bacterium]